MCHFSCAVNTVIAAVTKALRGLYTSNYWRKSCWRKYAQTVKSSPYTTQTIAKINYILFYKYEFLMNIYKMLNGKNTVFKILKIILIRKGRKLILLILFYI